MTRMNSGSIFSCDWLTITVTFMASGYDYSTLPYYLDSFSKEKYNTLHFKRQYNCNINMHRYSYFK